MDNTSFKQKNIVNNDIEKLFNELQKIENSCDSISELHFMEILGRCIYSINFNEKLLGMELTHLIGLNFNNEKIHNVSYNNDKTAISFMSENENKDQQNHCFYIGRNGVYYTNNIGLTKAHFSKQNKKNSITCCGFNLSTCCGWCLANCF